MLINTNKGGHTQLQKTKDPHALLRQLPIKDGEKEWHEGMFVEIGTEAKEADVFIQLVSGSYQSSSVSSRQIRGIISRTVMADRLATHFKLRCYGNFNNIFSVENAEQQLAKRRLKLGKDKH